MSSHWTPAAADAAQALLDVVLAADLDDSVHDPSWTATGIAARAINDRHLVTATLLEDHVIIDASALVDGAAFLIHSLIRRIALLENEPLLEILARTRSDAADRATTDRR